VSETLADPFSCSSRTSRPSGRDDTSSNLVGDAIMSFLRDQQIQAVPFFYHPGHPRPQAGTTQVNLPSFGKAQDKFAKSKGILKAIRLHRDPGRLQRSDGPWLSGSSTGPA